MRRKTRPAGRPALTAPGTSVRPRAGFVSEALERRILLSFDTFRTVNFGAPWPNAAVTMDANGNLFGATEYGGSFDRGTIYEIPHGGQGLTTLANFNGTNGTAPVGVSVDAAGNLFGATQLGGTNNDGTVFKIAAGSSTVTTLATFNGANGARPYSGVTLDAAGDLFGTTEAGGSGTSAAGTAYEIPLGSTTLTTLATFAAGTGINPQGTLTLDRNGNLFGTTNGGSAGAGTVFEIPRPAGGGAAITTIASFNGNPLLPSNGKYPYAGVSLDAAGDIFGTTHDGGLDNGGVVFEIAAGSKTITTLVNFDATTGARPSGGITLDAAGDLFGTTGNFGPGGYGTVFEIAAADRTAGTTVTTLVSFNDANGANPYPGVTLDPNGNLFGTTTTGGASGVGTVYEIAQNTAGANAVTTLANFHGTNARYPDSAVAVDASGNVFGTTSRGSDNGTGYETGVSYDGDGVLYELPVGSTTITALASFGGAAGWYPNGVTLDAAGNLFGTTTSGGPGGNGAVYEVARGSTALTPLAGFNKTNGSSPQSPLTLDAAGDLFGTTSAGGANNDGTVFEIAAGTNTITTLAGFDGTKGATPNGGLIRDAAGDLFGTTSAGGAKNVGVVFEIAAGTNTLTTLVDFNGTNGAGPSALSVDAAGDLFGATRGGGANSDGTVFEIPHGSATLTTLVNFNGANGSAPWGGATSDASGNLFGTTNLGGTSGQGTVFEIAAGSSTVTTLHNFDTNSEYAPHTGVTLDAVGDVFGTTNVGGAADVGTVFELTNRPAVLTVTPQDPTGAGAAAGATAGAGGGQRSIVTRIQVVFNEPVKLAAGAFTLRLANSFGSGRNDGSADTDVSSVLGTATNPSGDGITWLVAIVQSGTGTTYSYNLSTGGASLQDGVYRLGVAAAAVTALSGGAAMPAGYTSPLFHRLLGDADGNKTANALDYARFKSAFGSAVGGTGYNADLDTDGNGTVNAADYAQFKKRFGLTFTYT